MAKDLAAIKALGKQLYPTRDPSCLHPKESVVLIESTCYRIDARIMQCSACGSLLRGSYFCDDDNCTIPCVDFDPEWVAGPNRVESWLKLPKVKTEWETVKPLVPDLEPMQPINPGRPRIGKPV